MKFYLDQDTRNSRIFLAPFKVPKGKAYLIEFKTVWEANEALKKLNYGGIKDPMENPDGYRLMEEMENELGMVYIFQLVT